MDRVGANFEESVKSIQDRLEANPIVIQMPIGSEDQFRGIVDLLERKAYIWDDKTDGTKFRLAEIPEELKESAERARNLALEKIVEFDDGLIEKFLGSPDSITIEELKKTLRTATLKLLATPLLCGAAFKNKGIQPLLDAVNEYLPSPLDVPPIEGHDPENLEKAVKCIVDFKEPKGALAFKLASDSFAGHLVFVRVYSGILEMGAQLTNSRNGKKERVGKLIRMHANSREEIKALKAGEIGAVVGFKFTGTGDTLCGTGHKVVLESIDLPEPVISVALEAKSTADEEKMQEGLKKLLLEDPSASLRTDPETGQLLLSGMGELHLEILVDRLLREHKVGANVGKPQVSYRETITTSARGEGKFIRSALDGADPVYGHCVLEISPQEGITSDLEISVSENQIPKKYHKVIREGVFEALENGVLASFKVIGVRAKLVGGSFSEQDSSDAAFKVAAGLAFREAAKQAKAILLEPYFKLEVITPEEFTGNIIGDLNGRRGKISNMTQKGHFQVITAEAPLFELFGYATQIRSLSQGRASFSMEFCRYISMPQKVSSEILSRLGR